MIVLRLGLLGRVELELLDDSFDSHPPDKSSDTKPSFALRCPYCGRKPFYDSLELIGVNFYHGFTGHASLYSAE